MDLLDVIGRWLFWLFDGIGVNLIVKKIAEAFEKPKGDKPDNTNNQFISPKIPQL